MAVQFCCVSTWRIRSLSWPQSSLSTVINFLSASAIVRFIRAEGHAVVGRTLCFYISPILNMDCTKGFAYWWAMCCNSKFTVQEPEIFASREKSWRNVRKSYCIALFVVFVHFICSLRPFFILKLFQCCLFVRFKCEAIWTHFISVSSERWGNARNCVVYGQKKELFVILSGGGIDTQCWSR